jgi:hypothetical protein
MKIFKAIAENGNLVKGDAHSQKSLRELSLYDMAFLREELIQVVAFNDYGDPMFADAKTEFKILEGK